MSKVAQAPVIPPLQSGDCLTRVEFERRYAAARGIKAELIDGVVYVTSPVKLEHGDPASLVIAWLVTYAAATPGTRASCDASMRLDEANVPQPDAHLRRLPEAGGLSRTDADGYLAGGVELVAEVAASSAAYDLHQKKEAYRRHRCLEYVVVLVHEREVRWFAHREGEYHVLEPDTQGIIRSTVFPGLWLDTTALLEGDGARLLQTLKKGLESR